ncbi:MAG: nuclear transport factor 2 family protein [Sinimarinibacterium flocculans]|uniref:nuclear transport factor 2 family protein n=1 Tax=Sinimarinibacterium flocculans TaxID=985250 RepID=UPI003C6B259C
MDQTLLKEMATCVDRLAIERVLGLYCRAIDRLDLELLRSIYHADGFDDHGGIRANGHEFAEQIIGTLGQMCSYTMHTVTHSVVDVRGDTAVSEAYYLAVHTITGGQTAVSSWFGERYAEAQMAAGLLDQPHEYLCCGRYLDELHKRDGQWKIYRRQITNEWGVCRPAMTVAEGIPAAFTRHGSRDRSDPIYAFLG